MAALSKLPELEVIALQTAWSDPDGGCGTRGGVSELHITAP